MDGVLVMVVQTKVDQQLVEVACGFVAVLQQCLLVAREGTGEQVAATGRYHVYLLPQVHLELLKASLSLLDGCLGLQEVS